MPELQSDVICVKEYLRSQHMNVLDDWLEGCVQFFQSQRSGRSYSHQELNKMARDQWLLSNLSEICPGCLPGNLSSQRKTQLTGVYVLQMLYVLDIGVPAYQQLQKITGVDRTNIEVTIASNQSQFPEPTAQRMLKLVLTDGVQEISGMEYKSMRNLSVNLTPGTKLQIKGPLDCRRGMLMLEERHVTVLGGESEDIILVNQYANVLTRIVENNKNGIANGASNGTRFTRHPPPPQRQISARNNLNQNQNNVAVTNNLQRPANRAPTVNNYSNNRNSDQVISTNNSADDRELVDLDENMFNDDFDVDMIDRIEHSALNPSTSQHQNTPQAAAKKMRVGNSERNEYIVKKSSPKREEDFYEREMANNSFDVVQPDEEEEEFLRMVEMEDVNYCNEPFVPNNERNLSLNNRDNPNRYPIQVNDKPFVYLKQLIETPERDLINKSFTVKAQVISIINKLKFKNGDWDLKCKICDGTSFLDVDVAGDVLSSLVGYTSSEMSRMKNQMAANPQLKQKVVEGLKDAHRKLQTIDNLLEILYKSSGPCIMRLLEYNEEHLRQLKQRKQNISSE